MELDASFGKRAKNSGSLSSQKENKSINTINLTKNYSKNTQVKLCFNNIEEENENEFDLSPSKYKSTNLNFDQRNRSSSSILSKLETLYDRKSSIYEC